MNINKDMENQFNHFSKCMKNLIKAKYEEIDPQIMLQVSLIHAVCLAFSTHKKEEVRKFLHSLLDKVIEKIEEGNVQDL